VKAILRGYELVSGMKINFLKSKLVDINVERNAFACYAKTLNCTHMRVPFKYLRLEVRDNPRKKQFWEQILNKLSAKLSAWKGRFFLVGMKNMSNQVSYYSVTPILFILLKCRNQFVKASLASRGGSYGGEGRRTNLYRG